MPTTLTFDGHLTLLAEAGEALGVHAARAGFDAPVPTCPAWTVSQLVAHQAMVHRWAAGNLAGRPFERTQTQIHDEEADLLGYFRDGLAQLVEIVRSAPEDVDAMVFLKDAPPPRRFWARRQAHETTIHSVDAVAASLGRPPVAAEVEAVLPVDAAVAVDGIDELVCGFMPRGRSKLATGEPYEITIEPVDVADRWTLAVGEERLVAQRGAPEPGRPLDGEPTRLAGTAVALYLGLWNRGAEVTATGPGDILARWRQLQRVTWS